MGGLLVLAALAAATLFVYTNSVKQSAKTSSDAVRVVVATGDIAAGTSVDDAVASGDLAYRTVRQSDTADGVVTNLDSIKGQVVSSELFKGDQLTASRLGEASQQGLAYRISGVQRAMRVTFKADSGLLADLQEGDRVDVFATYKAQERSVTYLVARSALVLSVDNANFVSDSGDSSSNSDPTATGSAVISVPEKQAAALANAMQGGADSTFPLYLALAPKNHAQQQTFPPVVLAGDKAAQQ
jgi:Flp pilus assembly protein CpaB